ncbi:DUF2812 domain-containing protein [Cohnella ginsengisoli]|uniref:DUF2812 domain-containing protein n=1 Tax=Cohnella ginsengisoli TaxID=425004 RepID=A0A9X4QQR4_9BACL|nr:DUF2812 domain-containing protein [Cohnella ginsengisoli]MDG0794827.1 DUF2812 domain-containing protein [Cohnella ginsengisoli]
MNEYIELYRDMGWEYVNSYSGIWHYFRRPWEPGETPTSTIINVPSC